MVNKRLAFDSIALLLKGKERIPGNWIFKINSERRAICQSVTKNLIRSGFSRKMDWRFIPLKLMTPRRTSGNSPVLKGGEKVKIAMLVMGACARGKWM
jgi:hypothetical protein